MPNIYKTLCGFRDAVSSAGQTSGYQAEKCKLNDSLSEKELQTNHHCFSPILITTGIAAVSFFKASNVIKRPQCSGPHLTHFKEFLRKSGCLFTCPNMTISASLQICKFENWGSSVMPEVSGRPWNTPLAVEHITLLKLVNIGFLHNYLIPFTRLRKYWLFVAIKGLDCKKQVKVSGYL